MKKLSKNYDKYCQVVAEKNRANEKALARYVLLKNQERKEKLENGAYSEYANLLVSIINSKHEKDTSDGI